MLFFATSRLLFPSNVHAAACLFQAPRARFRRASAILGKTSGLGLSSVLLSLFRPLFVYATFISVLPPCMGRHGWQNLRSASSPNEKAVILQFSLLQFVHFIFNLTRSSATEVATITEASCLPEIRLFPSPFFSTPPYSEYLVASYLLGALPTLYVPCFFSSPPSFVFRTCGTNFLLLNTLNSSRPRPCAV